MTVNPNRRARFILIALLAAATTAIFITFLALSGSGTLQQEGSNTTGDPEKQPLLTEFGDFQCPHCARFTLDVLPALERDLIEPGTVRFEYRHYPFLSPESFAAAEASECARDQDRFREYHDRLHHLTAQQERHTPETLAEVAKDLGLDAPRFDLCLETGEKRARVMEDREYGSSLGVRGTPTLFLDGEQIEWRNYPDLKWKILRQIRKNSAKAPPGDP